MASATIGNAIATGADVPGVDLQRPYTVKKAKLDSPPASRDANGSATTGAGVGTDSEQERAKKRMLKKKYRHTFAIHSQSRTSCLSYEGNESPHFWGFKNLMMLVLIVSNLRLMIENFRKYGVLICIRCHDYRRQDVIYGTILYFLVPCHLFVAYLIELAAAQQAKGWIARVKKNEAEEAVELERKRRSFLATWRFVALAHGVNATLNLVVATTVVYYYIHHPGIGTLCEVHAVIVWLKVCSYAFTNRDLRHAMISPSASAPLPEIYASCPYPRNITMSNLVYFWWAPTLVYQPVYPRTSHTRWALVLRYAIEMVCLSIAIWIASAQYATPLLQNSLRPVSAGDLMSMAERVMKLSTISLFCWLAGFYAIFQSFLNALAEITRFADREFYADWWNVSSIREYWTAWNKPVSHFMRRHVYMPLIGRGVPRYVAQALVFVFSGALHEMLVGVPTHNILGVAFLGMVGQLPMILLTDALRRLPWVNGAVVGNLIFWVSFCLVGQPLAALLYFFAWHARYGSVSRGAQFAGAER